MGNRNSGRRPQPTSLKVLRGNPGQRRLNAREPEPPVGEVTKPETLSPGAADIWDQLAPLCLAMRTLTMVDAKPFAVLCELQATIERVSYLKKAGYWDQAMKLEKQYAPLVRPYYEYFGMTPASRARISLPKAKEEPAPKWAGILK